MTATSVEHVQETLHVSERDEQVRHVRSPYVFTTATGDNYEALGRISKAAIATMKAATIERGSSHTLRHTAASLMVQAGVPLNKVQKVLGQSTPIMTERYAHLAPQHLRGAIDVLDRALNASRSEEGRTTNVSTPTSTESVDAQVDIVGSTRSAGIKRNIAKSLQLRDCREQGSNLHGFSARGF